MAANVSGLGRLLCALTLMAWGHFVFADACDDKPPVTFSYQCTMTSAGYWACPTALSYQGCNYSSGGGGSCTSAGICSTKWYPSGPAGSGSTPCGSVSCTVVGGDGDGSTDPDPNDGSLIPVDTYYIYVVDDKVRLRAKRAAFSAANACHSYGIEKRDDDLYAEGFRYDLTTARVAYSPNHGRFGTCNVDLYDDGDRIELVRRRQEPVFYYKCPDYDPELCAEIHEQIMDRSSQDGNDEANFNDITDPSSAIEGGIDAQDLKESTDRVVNAVNTSTSSIDRVGDAIGISLSGLGSTLSGIGATLERIEGLVSAGNSGNGGNGGNGGNNGGGSEGGNGNGDGGGDSTPYDPAAEWTDAEARLVGQNTGIGIASALDAAADSAQQAHEEDLQAKFDALPDTVSGMLTPTRGALESVKHLLPTAEGCRDYVVPLDLMQYKADLTLPVCELSRVKPLLEWVLYVITVIGIWNIFYSGLRQQDAKATKGGF